MSELQSKEFSDGSGLDWYATELEALILKQAGGWKGRKKVIEQKART